MATALRRARYIPAPLACQSWLVNNFRSAALKAGMKHVETSAAPALKRKETKANFNLNA